jgi:hypothetical protein
VIAERRCVDVQHIGYVIDRRSSKQGRHRSALHQVAGIQVQTVVTTCPFAAKDRGKLSEATLIPSVRQQVGV